MKRTPTNSTELEHAKTAAWLAFKAEPDFHKAEKLHRKFLRAYNRWRGEPRVPVPHK